MVDQKTQRCVELSCLRYGVTQPCRGGCRQKSIVEVNEDEVTLPPEVLGDDFHYSGERPGGIGEAEREAVEAVLYKEPTKNILIVEV